jgi:virginiamycin A acetyltransferase
MRLNLFKSAEFRFLSWLKKKLFVVEHNFINTSIMRGTLVSGDCNIGEFSYIGYNCSITKCTIGRYCSIANNVSIGVGEHDTSKISTCSLFYKDAFKELTKKDIILGNDVWIGTNSVIRRGVKIGDGAIIGANSFVNKDVPDFAIVAGCPATIIRMRFPQETIDKIKKTKWWVYNLSEARSIVEKLSSNEI